MKEFRRELRQAQEFIVGKVKKETQKLKDKEVFSSVGHIETALEKIHDKVDEQTLRDIYWHLGVIKGTVSN